MRGKCFLAWCRHQTTEYKPDDVTIPIDSGKTLISGSRFLFIEPDESNAEEEFPDLCAMEFIPDNYDSANLDAVFFPLIETDCWSGNARGSDSSNYIHFLDARFLVTLLD